jgi:hypothetical protein
MNALNLSACWREASETEFHYVRSGKTIGLVSKAGKQFYAEAERRPGSVLRLGSFDSRLAAMAVVQDALIGPTSDGAALGRAALAADPLPHDEFHGFQSFVGY